MVIGLIRPMTILAGVKMSYRNESANGEHAAQKEGGQVSGGQLVQGGVLV